MDLLLELQKLPSIDETTRKRIQEWLSFDSRTRNQIIDLFRASPQKLIDAFYTTLTFGTGGLRGIMGPGTNRMNTYMVQMATQGLANYLLQVHGKTKITVAIGYDSRHNSKEFAENAARVLAGNNINVLLFQDIRPTPLVSFACLYKGCQAGIMITASHNPPEYNGYKVYWSDGGQVLPPHDVGIMQAVGKIETPKQVKLADRSSPNIKLLGVELDKAYLDAISKVKWLQPKEKLIAELSILYSSLHGTGITIVPKALSRFGFTQLGYVEEQITPDGNFPNAPSPNPEEEAALQLGINKLLRDPYDIFIATDPDCDRLGVVVKHKKKAVILNGSQVGAICAGYLVTLLTNPKTAAFVKSIVTTDLIRQVVVSHNATCIDVLPGFKYFAEKIHEWEESHTKEFVFGAEESYGYLVGTVAHDKDAAVTSCLLAQIASTAKSNKKTLVDLLEELYMKYGYYQESQFSIKFPEGKVGKEKQVAMMAKLRKNPIQSFGNLKVRVIGDGKKRTWTTLATNKTAPMELPEADVLIYQLEDGSSVVIRPSGTEPKTKVYLMLKHSSKEGLERAKLEVDQKRAQLEQIIHSII